MTTTGTVEATVGDGDPLWEGILTSVSQLTGIDTNELPILYDTVDVDAVDQLCRRSDDSLVVHFDYAGCEVRVGGDGTLLVTG